MQFMHPTRPPLSIISLVVTSAWQDGQIILTASGGGANS